MRGDSFATRRVRRRGALAAPEPWRPRSRVPRSAFRVPRSALVSGRAATARPIELAERSVPGRSPTLGHAASRPWDATQNTERKTRNAQRGTHNAERGTTERTTQNTQRGTRNAERRTDNAERGTRNVGRGTAFYRACSAEALSRAGA